MPSADPTCKPACRVEAIYWEGGSTRRSTPSIWGTTPPFSTKSCRAEWLRWASPGGAGSGGPDRRSTRLCRGYPGGGAFVQTGLPRRGDLLGRRIYPTINTQHLGDNAAFFHRPRPRSFTAPSSSRSRRQCGLGDLDALGGQQRRQFVFGCAPAPTTGSPRCAPGGRRGLRRPRAPQRGAASVRVRAVSPRRALPDRVDSVAWVTSMPSAASSAGSRSASVAIEVRRDRRWSTEARGNARVGE